MIVGRNSESQPLMAKGAGQVSKSAFSDDKVTRPLSKAELKFYGAPEDHTLFYTPELVKTVEALRDKIPTSGRIWIYPDATLKANKLPTGIAYLDEPQTAILFPHILRDPGCGYLTFKIEFHQPVTPELQKGMGELLEALVNPIKIEQDQPPQYDYLRSLIKKGLHALDLPPEEAAAFMYLNFLLDPSQVEPTVNELKDLSQDFMKITNTVEIRTVHPTGNAVAKEMMSTLDFTHSTQRIGFIHTGSHEFPYILTKRFTRDLATYALQHGLATDADIDTGLWGVPFRSELGQFYYHWLCAAMNYALVSRYQAYRHIKSALESNFACTLSLINDNPHAGIFKKTIAGKKLLYSVRGVQHIFSADEATKQHAVTLVAGQRESMAALVTGSTGTPKVANLLNHGTGYEILTHYDYTTRYSTNEIAQYRDWANNTLYNSEAEIDANLPYTTNLTASLDYFVDKEIIQVIAYLAPWINIQSAWLKNTEKNN